MKPLFKSFLIGLLCLFTTFNLGASDVFSQAEKSGASGRVIAQGDDVGRYVRVVDGATEFLTNQTAINNFSDEIININRQFSDGVLLNGTPSSAINTALYQGTVVDQAASIFKSISRNHMFANGNKRTAVEMFKSFASKSNIPVNLTDNQLLDIATQVATGTLDNVSQIGAALIK